MPMLEFAITGTGATQAAQALEELLTEIDGGPPQRRVVTHPQASTQEKGIDPVSLASLVVAVPCGILAVLDLVERVRKRPKAEQLIALARQLTRDDNVSITITLSAQPGAVPRPLESLTPDQLLELATQEGLVTTPATGRSR